MNLIASLLGGVDENGNVNPEIMHSFMDGFSRGFNASEQRNQQEMDAINTEDTIIDKIFAFTFGSKTIIGYAIACMH
jgi:hypothetical protein